MQQSSGPAQELGSAALALTNHDKESFNFGVMAEASVLPPTRYGAEASKSKIATDKIIAADALGH